MTNMELIKILEGFPHDAVVRYDYDGGYQLVDITEVSYSEGINNVIIIE